MISGKDLHVAQKLPVGNLQNPQQQVDRTPVFKWAMQTYGITMPEAQQAYQQMAQQAQAKGRSINELSNAQLVATIKAVMSSPKIQAIGKQNGHHDQKGNVIPGSITPQGAPHLSEGGLTLPKGKSIVGDAHPTSPHKPNPEIINNPTGAPVSVTPIHPSKGHMKQYCNGTNMTAHHYDDGTPVVPPPAPEAQPTDTTSQPPMDEVVVTGSPPPQGPSTNNLDTSSQSPDLPVTNLANVLGMSKDDVMKILPQLTSAYSQYIQGQKGLAAGNAGMTLGGWISGGAAGGANAQNSINSENEQLAKNTIGIPVAEQTAQSKALENANVIQNANQQGFENQAKNQVTAINSKILVQAQDANSPLSVMTRQTLIPEMQKAGMKTDGLEGASAAQLSALVAGNAPLEKIVNDSITANAAMVKSQAEKQTAATGQGTEAFAQGLVLGHPQQTVAGPGQTLPAPAPTQAPAAGNAAGGAPATPAVPTRQYVMGQHGPELAPEEAAGAKTFQDRAQTANEYTANAGNVSNVLDNALSQTIATPSGWFGPASIKRMGSQALGAGPAAQLQPLYQKIGNLTLADAAQSVGGTSMLRSSTIDQKLMNIKPDVQTDTKPVAMVKVLTQEEAHLRTQAVSQELSDYVKQHPEDPKGTNFSSNVPKLVFVANVYPDAKGADGTPLAADKRTALVTPQQAKVLAKQGYLPMQTVRNLLGTP